MGRLRGIRGVKKEVIRTGATGFRAVERGGGC